MLSHRRQFGRIVASEAKRSSRVPRVNFGLPELAALLLVLHRLRWEQCILKTAGNDVKFRRVLSLKTRHQLLLGELGLVEFRLVIWRHFEGMVHISHSEFEVLTDFLGV